MTGGNLDHTPARPRTVGAKRTRPGTVKALFEYAYAEAGRKLGLSRHDFASLTVDHQSHDDEIALVRQLATDDPLLTVPPALLAAVAELAVDGVVRRRVVDLVRVALDTHPLLAGRFEECLGGESEPVVTARDLSNDVARLNPAALGMKDKDEFKPAAREQLRVNAVAAFGLIRVLQDSWGPERFTAEMAELVWTAPYERGPRAAALLAGATNFHVLSQLCRQFEVAARDRERDLEEARASVQNQHRRALAAEVEVQALTERLLDAFSRAEKLSVEVTEITKRLTVVQANRVVDKSHLIDDYEILRGRVLRRLTGQVGLLSDGLHALQNGSPDVAEEFVDRALTSITTEVARLKNVAGGNL